MPPVTEAGWVNSTCCNGAASGIARYCYSSGSGPSVHFLQQQLHSGESDDIYRSNCCIDYLQGVPPTHEYGAIGME
jgi:hypothetical protein